MYKTPVGIIESYLREQTALIAFEKKTLWGERLKFQVLFVSKGFILYDRVFFNLKFDFVQKLSENK